MQSGAQLLHRFQFLLVLLFNALLRRSVLFLWLVIAQHSQSLQLILILKQSMSRHYQRTADKQNQYAHETSYQNKMALTPSSNKVLRKKLDDKMQSKQDEKQCNMERYAGQSAKARQKDTQIGVINQSNQNNFSRRQNARSRGFDMHVTNIENINDKISSLLGMIKKDKVNHEQSSKHKSKNYLKANQSSPSISLIQRITKEKNMSSFEREKLTGRAQAYGTSFRDDRMADKQSKSVSKIRDFNILEVVQEQNNEKQVSKVTRGKYKYQEGIKKDYSQQKYKISAQNQIKKGNQRQKMLKQCISIPQYPLIKDTAHSALNLYKKIQNASCQSMAQISWKQHKINGINEMYQEKRNERLKTRNEQNLKFQRSIKEDLNRESFQLNKMISKDASAAKSIYQVLSQQTFQNILQQSSMNYPSSSAQDHMMPKHFNKEENLNRNEKINTTTRIIDDQIKRIKSKIQESEQNNSKLKQKFRQNKQDQFVYTDKKGYDDSHSHQARNQKFSSPVLREKQHISRMALKLSDQAEIDLRLKRAREFFQKYGNESKWDQLKHQTDKRGLNLSLNNLKQIMKMGADEHNPFGNSKGGQMKMQRIAQLLYEAQSHWQEQVQKRVAMKHLKEQNIQISDLDLNKKGYLNIEDLVCFINLYSGEFYRNRDISLIFRRLQRQSGELGSKISYNSFLKVLTN